MSGAGAPPGADANGLPGGGAPSAGGGAPVGGDAITRLCRAVDRQLYVLVEWARLVPGFVKLPVGDQLLLLRSGVFLLPIVLF